MSDPAKISSVAWGEWLADPRTQQLVKLIDQEIALYEAARAQERARITERPDSLADVLGGAAGAHGNAVGARAMRFVRAAIVGTPELVAEAEKAAAADTAPVQAG